MANEAPVGSMQYIGRGEVYFAKDGIGELFLGNCPGFTIQVQDTEERSIYSSVDAASQRLKQVFFRRAADLTIESTEMKKEVLELHMMGGLGALNNGAGSVTNQAVTAVKQGYWYRTLSAGVHKRNISAVAVTGPSGTPTYVLNTDYKIDAVAGRIYIVPGGGIADASNVEFDFTYAADTDPFVTIGNATDLNGRVRVICSEPLAGPAMEVELWDVRLTADSAAEFISDDFVRLRFKGSINFDSTQAAGQEYGRIIYR